MSINTAVDKLYEKGLSYSTLAIVTGIHVKDVKEARKEPALLSLESRNRCHRLNQILEEAMERDSNDLDPVAVFEEHILLGKVGEKTRWVKISELWSKGRLDDQKLKDILQHTKSLYSYEELRMNHPMEYEVVEGGDGYKAILAKLPISRAEGQEILQFSL